ncbi:MAG: TonB-dependent receptor, partial [Longimicrobiales bacterium]|nr:TonB-dependent receptor [Longimicrobiales bacterium]
FKISGQYMSGEEWIYFDPAELAADSTADANPARCQADRQARGLTPEEAELACSRIAQRDFDLERWSIEARADWRFAEDGTVIATYGRNSSSGIELTGLGAGQTNDWVYDFFQARMTKGRLFAQGYYNGSSSGDSFLLRDGVTLVDESSLVVGQLQHGFDIAEGRQDFTYGIDYFGTNPASAGRIYGSYEDRDEMDEWGVYLQSETAISPRLDLILAGRVDDHSVLADQVFSPRAALVFKPDSTSGIRLSYNRAFSTPTALNFFLDISGGFAPAPLGGLGFTTRAFGSGTDGWSVRGPDGTFEWMRSPFTPSALGGPGQLLPADMPTLWNFYVGVLEAQGLPGPQAAFLRANPPTEEQVTRLALDVNDNSVEPLASLSIPRLPATRESNTETFEIGYTGVINNRVAIAADVYRTTKNDFVSPLRAETPLIFLDPEDIEAYLTPFVGPDQAAALAVQVPLGVVSSEDVGAQAADIIVSYRNVGDITLYGGDLSLQAFLTDRWTVGGSYSFVSDDVFPIADGAPIALNAPQHKGSVNLAYRTPRLNASTRLRFNSEFEAFSADFAGVVQAAAIVDLTAGYRIPNTAATVQLSVSNLFGNLLENEAGDRFEPYRSFVGAPEIGRFTMLAVRYDLF